MNRNATPETDSNPLDLAGLVLIASVALACAVLALLGWSLAAQALPFLAGALVGDGLVVLAVRLPRYRTPLVISALMLVAAGLVLSFNLTVGLGTGFPIRLPWEIPSVVERFSFGVLLGFGGCALSSSPRRSMPRGRGEKPSARGESWCG